MWPRLILSLLLVHWLAASPAPATGVNRSTDAWSPEEACAMAITTMIQNENDSTCTSFVLCYVANGSPLALIKNCSSGHYFNPSLGFCSVTKPVGCS